MGARNGKVPLTRARAVQVAIRIADREGIQSLTMRKLAGELGVEAMSLYHHVKNKEALVDCMMDAVYTEIAPPTADPLCRRPMRERVESERSVLARHPWALTVPGSRTSSGEATLKHHDTVVRCLLAAGFSMPMVGHAMSLLDSYVRGFSMQEASLPGDDMGQIGDATQAILRNHQDTPSSFPHLAEMALTVILKPGYAYGNEFAFGLRLILAGIHNAHLAEAPESPARITP